MLEDNCLIGIFTILERLLQDNPEYVEEFALEYGLLEEIFYDCLFQDVTEAPQIDLTSSFDPNSTDLHTSKCKTKESRAKAFTILNLLCYHSSKVRDIVYRDCLIKMVSKIERPETFAYLPESESRHLYSNAGLKNLGATCYMNSMIQQLYMIPAFRYLLLCINDGVDEDFKTVEDEKSVYHNKKIDDNLLHQFQNTMGFLELTERPYYNSVGLCFSMKDYDGNPTNCSLQQDSHEFVNLLFDRLEDMIKPTPQKYLIKDNFSAKQCTHMTCSNCSFVKQKIEDYYILSLPVKNFSKLEDSLNAYIDGEVISDFRCDNCDKKVDINKRCSFIDMPNILMIHLQKIVFNFDTLMNEKIADRFEFPTMINMENYNIRKIVNKYGINDPDIEKYAYIDDENFEYRLVGVIIHQGVAEAGHYYSLICNDNKLKDKNKGLWEDTSNYSWTEFNDTTVKDFQFRRNFEDECFGKSNADIFGSHSTGVGGGWDDGWQSFSGGSSKSAYVLIYEKRNSKDIRICTDLETSRNLGKTSEQIQEEIKEEKRRYISSFYAQYESTSSTLAQSDSDNKTDVKMESQEEIDAFMSSLECGDIALPRDLFPYLVFPRNTYIFFSQEEKDKLKYIPVHHNKEDNECYIKVNVNEVQKFVPYRIFKKVWDDNNSFSSERQLNNADFFQFFKQTLSREDIVNQQDDQEKLALIYELCIKMIYNMLVYAFNNESISEVSDVLKKVLLLSDHAIVEFSDFMLQDNGSEFVRILFKCSDGQVREAVSTILSTAVNRMFDRVDLIEKAEKFMTIMINSIKAEAAPNWTKFEQFFHLLLQVTIGGDAQLEFMRKNHLETVLADFFLAERSPIRPPDEKRICMGNAYSKPIYESLVKTICYISRHTDVRTDPDNQNIPESTLGNQLFKPNENEKKVIVNKHFASKAIRDSFEAEAVGKLIAHWCYQDEESSQLFASVFLTGINETDYEEVAPFLVAMQHFLNLRDGLETTRMEWLIGVPMLLDGSPLKACPPDQPRFGAYAISTVTEEVFYFPTTLEHVDSINESILSLIWRSRQRFESYTLFCIKELLNLGEDIIRYISKMPSPNYQYSRYTDWIFQYVKDKYNSNLIKNPVYTETLQSLMSAIDSFETKIKIFDQEYKEEQKRLYYLNDVELEYADKEDSKQGNEELKEDEKVMEVNSVGEENIKNLIQGTNQQQQQTSEPEEYKAFPRPYIIGKVLNEVETDSKQENEMRIVLSELVCQHTWAKPAGKRIKTKDFLDVYLCRKRNIINWNKSSNKKTVFSKNQYNENYIDPVVSAKQNEEESMQQEDEETALKPICEDYEGIDEESKNNQDIDSTPTLDQEMQQEDDDKVNDELNDRDTEEIPELIEGQFDENNQNVPENTLDSRFEDPEEADTVKQYPPAYPEVEDRKSETENNQDAHMKDQEEDSESKLYDTNPVVLRLSVYNFCNKKIKVEVRVKSKDDSPNFIVPVCSIKAEIPANKSKTIAYFHKLHPYKPFGEYYFEYTSDIQLQQEVARNEMATAASNEQAQGGDESENNHEIKVWNPESTENFEGMQNEINCDACTLFNPISNHKCSICGTVLPHRR